MNTLGANLASVRPAHEPSSGRTNRDDENSAAFGALLGSLADEPPPAGRASSPDPAHEAEARDSESRPSGDAASALTILAAMDSSAAMTAVPADSIQALLARALPSGVTPSDRALELTLDPTGPSVPGAPIETATPVSLGRLRVTVIAQETHFAPVMPHPVSLKAVPSAAATPPGSGAAVAGLVQETLAEGAPGIGLGQPTLAASSAVPATGLANPPVGTGTTTVVPNEAPPSQSPGAIPNASATTLAAGVPSAAMPARADDPASPAQLSAPPAVSSTTGATQAAQSAVPAPAPKPARPPAMADRFGDAAEREDMAGEIAPTATLVRREVAQAAAGIGESRVATGAVQEPHPEIGQSGPSAAIGMASSAAGEPSRQVAEAVMAQMGRMQPAAQPGLEGPLRILTIQLRPDDLGTVVVRMRLRGDQLEMSLHASREETAALLRSDAAALDGLLRSAGYQPDLVTIGSARADAPAYADSARSGAGSGFDGQNGQNSDPGGAMADQSGQRRRDAERHDIQREPNGNDTIPVGPGRIGRYL